MFVKFIFFAFLAVRRDKTVSSIRLINVRTVDSDKIRVFICVDRCDDLMIVWALRNGVYRLHFAGTLNIWSNEHTLHNLMLGPITTKKSTNFHIKNAPILGATRSSSDKHPKNCSQFGRIAFEIILSAIKIHLKFMNSLDLIVTDKRIEIAFFVVFVCLVFVWNSYSIDQIELIVLMNAVPFDCVCQYS